MPGFMWGQNAGCQGWWQVLLPTSLAPTLVFKTGSLIGTRDSHNYARVAQRASVTFQSPLPLCWESQMLAMMLNFLHGCSRSRLESPGTRGPDSGLRELAVQTQVPGCSQSRLGVLGRSRSRLRSSGARGPDSGPRACMSSNLPTERCL